MEVASAARPKPLVALYYVLWYGALLCIDLGCRDLFGPDYFRRSGFLGFVIAFSLGTVPFRYPKWRREREERRDAHRAFMQRHHARMARLS